MADELRILRIITRLNVGGPSLQAIDLSVNQNNWKTRLLSGQLKEGEVSLHAYMENKNIEHHTLQHLVHPLHPLKDLWALFELICEIKKFQPDVIHTHHAKAGLLGRVAALLCGVVVVHTFHGNVFRGHYSPMKSKIICLVEKCLSPLAHRLIAISPSQQKDLTELFKITHKNKCPVIPLGFHLERFENCSQDKNKARESNALPSHVPLIGIVGRLTHVKNHHFFLEVFAQGDSTWHCVIIGDGELENDIKEQVKQLKIEDRVHFKATCNNIEKYYATLDILAITSHSEGTPVTMIEAMAQGLAVVAADVGGIPDLAAGTERALLYPAGSKKECLEAFQQCLNNPSATLERCQKAKDYVSRTHSFAALSQQLDALYREILP